MKQINYVGVKYVELSKEGEAFIVMLTMIIPALLLWINLGMPTDSASIGVLVSAILVAVLYFLNKLLGKNGDEEQPTNKSTKTKKCC